MHRKNLAAFERDERFNNIRLSGTIAALDLAVQEATGYLADVGPQMRKLFRERGLLIRPLGNVIYLMPPYCVAADELDRAYEAIDEVASILLRRA
ncbi:Adenosylmethionine-8-amino-7-oxononanoate aminotransferase [compost metagenome]